MEVFDPKQIVESLTTAFLLAEFTGVPDMMVEAIHRNRIDQQPWQVVLHGQTYHGVTFFAKAEKPQTIADAFHACITETIPSLKAVLESDKISFILPYDEVQNLILAVDLYGDTLNLHNSQT